MRHMMLPSVFHDQNYFYNGKKHVLAYVPPQITIVRKDDDCEMLSNCVGEKQKPFLGHLV
jgi:hypothetical protein